MGAATPPNPTPLRNSYWVVPGKVLAGEHPGGTTREATRERLERLIAAGVECFIDLTEPGELKPYDTELPFSIEYLRKPIRDHGIPAQRGHMVSCDHPKCKGKVQLEHVNHYRNHVATVHKVNLRVEQTVSYSM